MKRLSARSLARSPFFSFQPAAIVHASPSPRRLVWKHLFVMWS